MSLTTYPAMLREGDLMNVNGEFFTVTEFRDSIVNSRTGQPDIAIEFEGQDWVQILPRHVTIEVIRD